MWAMWAKSTKKFFDENLITNSYTHILYLVNLIQTKYISISLPEMPIRLLSIILRFNITFVKFWWFISSKHIYSNIEHTNPILSISAIWTWNIFPFPDALVCSHSIDRVVNQIYIPVPTLHTNSNIDDMQNSIIRTVVWKSNLLQCYVNVGNILLIRILCDAIEKRIFLLWRTYILFINIRCSICMYCTLYKIFVPIMLFRLA